MIHKPSTRAFVNRHSSSARWVDVNGATYLSNGYSLLRLDDDAEIAYYRTALEDGPPPDSVARVIEQAAADKAVPTPVVVESDGTVARVFRTPSGPVGCSLEWLKPITGGKATHDGCLAYHWTFGLVGPGGAIAAWDGDACVMVAMVLVVGGELHYSDDMLARAAEPVEAGDAG